MLSTNEELESLKQPSNIASIEILKSPAFWANSEAYRLTQNSWRSSHAQGDAKATAKFFEMIHPSFGAFEGAKVE